MVTAFLSDDVIHSTDLRKNQKYWFDKANVSPVSVVSGTKKLVLLNREQAKDMYLRNYYATQIIHLCKERNSGQVNDSNVFPWIKHLSEKAITEFWKELFSAFDEAIHSRNWLAFEEMLNSWISTAEAMTNSEMVELLSTDLNNEKYTRVE